VVRVKYDPASSSAHPDQVAHRLWQILGMDVVGVKEDEIKVPVRDLAHVVPDVGDCEIVRELGQYFALRLFY